MPRIVKFITILSCMIVLVACSNDSEETSQIDSSSEEEKETITITDFSDRTLEFSEKPEKIVALGNGETDIVYALGESVVGRPSGETPIKEAEEALEVGSSHSIDLEKLTYLSPDVVLGNFPMNQKDIPSVENLGAELVLTSANSVDDILKQITLFGELLDKNDEAEKITSSINDHIEDIKANSLSSKPRALLIYGAPGSDLIALPNSLSGDILEIAGGENIASQFESLEEYPQYAALNSERIIDANPEIIFIMSHGNVEETKESVMKQLSKKSGWEHIDAIKNEQIHFLPKDLFGTNPGTRITEAIDHMYDLLKDVES